ncbi:hypothetical protein [Rhodococcus zopfii]|uniref:hypothetical protein n=1 Tax=Rhodococcus zopfii TaxID=43772 RepID=UPI003529D140
MSEAAVERTVKIGLIAYRGPDGAVRRAQNGATVLVHPDHVERFDRLNVLPSAEASADVDAVDADGDGDPGAGDGDPGAGGDAPQQKPSRTSRIKVPAGDKE